jgi:hypothetical protein
MSGRVVRTAGVSITAAAVLGAAGMAHGAVTRQLIAYKGQPVADQNPGLDCGAVPCIVLNILNNNAAPALSDAGIIPLTASTQLGVGGASQGTILISAQTGGLSTIAREGAAPFAGLNSFTAVGPAGQIGFSGWQTGFTGSAASLYEFVAATPSPRASPGDATPNVLGSTLGTIGTVPNISAGGHFTFTSGILTPSASGAIFSGLPGSARLVARPGSTGEGIGTGVTGVNFTSLGGITMVNASGRVVLFGATSGTSASGIFVGTPDGANRHTLAPLARQGQAAPGFGAGVNYSGSLSSPPSARTLDRHGNVAFVTTVSGTGVTVPTNNDALFNGTLDAGVSLLYREADALPPVSGITGTVRWTLTGSNTQIAYDGAGTGAADARLFIRTVLGGTAPDVTTATDNVILVRDSGGVLSLIAREGDAAPGLVDVTLGNITQMAVNRNGTVAFVAGLSGSGVSSSNDTAVFLKKWNEPAVLLLREGDFVDVTLSGSTQAYAVGSIQMRGGNAIEDGSTAGLNNADRVAVGVNLLSYPDLPVGSTALVAVLVLADEDPVPTNVVCCRGSTCAFIPAAECTVPVGAVVGVSTPGGAACNAAGDAVSPCCLADFNKADGVTIDDIFIYLNAWFATSDFANVGEPGAPNIDDIFIFLNAWFGGCAPTP